MTDRDYNREFQDGERRYAYDFDTVLRRFTLRTLDPFMRGGKALELGCYKGDVTAMLAERYQDLTVVEASDALIAEARQRVPSHVRFVHSTFETVDLADRFDDIFLIHTLEHLDDAVGVLALIKGWLSEHGRLHVVVPNANAPSRQVAVHMGLITHCAAVTDAERAHGHRITYSLDTLERDASAAGLSIRHRGGVFFKGLANFQFDRLMDTDIISADFLEGCYRLGMRYPDLCASVYLVCER